MHISQREPWEYCRWGVQQGWGHCVCAQTLVTTLWLSQQTLTQSFLHYYCSSYSSRTCMLSKSKYSFIFSLPRFKEIKYVSTSTCLHHTVSRETSRLISLRWCKIGDTGDEQITLFSLFSSSNTDSDPDWPTPIRYQCYFFLVCFTGETGFFTRYDWTLSYTKVH